MPALGTLKATLEGTHAMAEGPTRSVILDVAKTLSTAVDRINEQVGITMPPLIWRSIIRRHVVHDTLTVMGLQHVATGEMHGDVVYHRLPEVALPLDLKPGAGKNPCYIAQ